MRPVVRAGEKAASGLAAALLAAVAWAAYRNSFAVGFPLDNHAIILEASHVHTASWDNVGAIFSHSYWWPKLIDHTYRPLTTLSYLLNYAVLGGASDPTSYHWVNLVLHWLNAVLVFQLARRLGLLFPYAVAAAALFVTHPLTTEAVTNIVGRADLLATFSVLGGLLLHLRSRTAVHAWPWQVGLVVLTFLGLLCKETAATVLAVVMLHDGLVPTADSAAARTPQQSRRWCLDTYLLLAMTMLAVWGLRTWVGRGTIPWPTLFTENVLVDQPFLEARLTAIKVLGQNLGQILWPARLCWDYSVHETEVFAWQLATWEDLQVPVTMIVLTAGAVWLWHLRRWSTMPLFAAGFFFLAWLPTSNLLLLIGWSRADRFLYLPLVGVAWLLAWMTGELAARCAEHGHRWVGRLLPIALAAVVLALGVRTHRRNPDWQNALTICGRDVQSCPDSFRTHQCLAEALMVADPHGNVDRALDEVELAQRIVTENVPRASTLPPPVVDNLAKVYRAKAAEVPPAARREWVEKTVDALERLTRWQQALDRRYRDLAPAHGLRPDEVREIGPPSHYITLGQSYAELGRHRDAIATLQHAAQMTPGRAAIYDALARSYVAIGDHDNAILSLLRTFFCDASQQQVWPPLRALYQTVDPNGCAFMATPSGPQLDRSCPLVRAHLCRALSGLQDNFVAARLATDAERVATTIREFGCPPDA